MYWRDYSDCVCLCYCFPSLPTRRSWRCVWTQCTDQAQCWTYPNDHRGPTTWARRRSKVKKRSCLGTIYKISTLTIKRRILATLNTILRCVRTYGTQLSVWGASVDLETAVACPGDIWCHTFHYWRQTSGKRPYHIPHTLHTLTHYTRSHTTHSHITHAHTQALHFSPALYKYVVSDLKKQLVLVLNKAGLTTAHTPHTHFSHFSHS